jgi:hypothetical protein
VNGPPVTNIIVNRGSILDYFRDWIITGETLVPSLVVTAAVMGINLLLSLLVVFAGLGSVILVVLKPGISKVEI